MKPPVCSVCNQHFEANEGSLVAFADYEPLPEGATGHPRGLEWVCPEHIQAALGLRNLDSKHAIAQLRRNSSSD